MTAVARPRAEPAAEAHASAEPQHDRAADVHPAAERWFRSLVERAPDVIALLNADGNFSHHSPGLAHALGFRSEDLLQRPSLDLVHPDDLPRMREVFAQLLAEPGAVVEAEYRARHRTGDWRFFRSTAQNLLQDPVVAAILVTSHDVTERKNVEEALRRSEEQVRHAHRLATIGHLASGAAHDFNNVLTVIRTTVEGILLDLPPDSPLRDDLALISDSTNRAAALTRQILAIGRPRVAPARAIDLNHVIQGLQPALQRLFGRHVALTVALDSAGCRVHADPGQMEQVIVNLAVNARDAMPGGGQLEVRTTNVCLSPAEAASPSCPVPPGAYVSIVVTDTGYGMDVDTLARIFEPFFTTKPDGHGTGLGLPTACGIIQQYGGGIHVESARGAGTTISVYLPAVTTHGLPATPSPR